MRRLSALWCLLAPTALPSQAAPAPAPPDSGPLAITRVTVVDVERGRHLPGRTVLVEGNRITAAGPAAAVRVPVRARVVDGRGKFLIPGLWDMHAHVLRRWEVGAPLYLANGVTGVRDVGTDVPAEKVAAHRAALRAGRIVGPRFVTAGPLLAGRDQFPERPGLTIIVTTPEEARRAVDSVARAGFDLIKVHNFLSRDAFFAIAREARSRDLPFAGHLPHVVSVAEGSDSGMRSMEHLRGVEGACSADEEAYLRVQRAAYEAGAPDRDTSRVGREAFLRAINSYVPAKCAALGSLLRRNGTWVTPTLVGGTANRVSHDSLLRDSRLRYVPAAVAEDWRRRLPGVEVDSGLAQWQRFRPQILRPFHRAGVGLLAGTDANYRQINVFFGFSVHDELALFVRAGLTPLQALQAGTLNAARYLNATDSLGTVAAGKLADLVLLDADPLVDIRNTTKIRAVVANGRLFDRAALDALVAAAERAANPPAPRDTMPRP